MRLAAIGVYMKKDYLNIEMVSPEDEALTPLSLTLKKYPGKSLTIIVEHRRLSRGSQLGE